MKSSYRHSLIVIGELSKWEQSIFKIFTRRNTSAMYKIKSD